jgi:hypothetical protein
VSEWALDPTQGTFLGLKAAFRGRYFMTASSPSALTNLQRATSQLLFAGFWLVVSSCSGNAFKASESGDPAEDAVIELENDNPKEAIKILEKALVITPGEPKLISILSSAYAQRAGVEPLSMARNLASPSGTSSGGGATDSTLISLFGVTPRATADSVADISYAVSLLTVELSPDLWLPGDQFKLAIYQTCASVLSLKILDKDEDGKLSIDEIASLSSAASILAQLAASQSVLSQDPNDTSSVKAAEVLSKYQASINASEGGSADEKLKNYLAKSSGNASTSTAALIPQ